jgi:hypothetical protein
VGGGGGGVVGLLEDSGFRERAYQRSRQRKGIEMLHSGLNSSLTANITLGYKKACQGQTLAYFGDASGT